MAITRGLKKMTNEKNFQKLIWYVQDVVKNDLEKNNNSKEENEIIRFLTYVIKDVYDGKYEEAQDTYNLINKMFNDLIGLKKQ